MKIFLPLQKLDYSSAGLVALILFAFILRIHGLSSESLWMDELRQTSYYPFSFHEILYLAALQLQPPLDYWIGRIFLLFSPVVNEFSLRLPAAIFGTGVIMMIAIILKTMVSWPVRFGCAIIAALLPFHLYYSQEARPYSIAVFFFLSVLWAMNRLLNQKEYFLKPSLCLFFCSIGFLYTRAFFPLVIVFCLVCILIALTILHFKSPGFRDKALLAVTILSSAVLIYLPVFRLILTSKSSSSYLISSSISDSIKNLFNTVCSFDIMPAIRAFFAQTEPLSMPFLILVFLSYYFGWVHFKKRQNYLVPICLILLPMATFINLFVFQFTTNYSFRPPYASYILPLVLILSAVSVHEFLQLIATRSQMKWMNRIGIPFLILLFLPAGLAAIDYKKQNRKPDWRSVCKYSSDHFNSNTLLVFDALSPYGQWEPTFYGFPFYYNGNSDLISMKQIPDIAHHLYNINKVPVLILFHWQKYLLTSKSENPLVYLPKELEQIDYTKLKQHPSLKVKEFTGFSVIETRKPTGSTVENLMILVNSMIDVFPKDDFLIENYLAAAALSQVQGELNSNYYKSEIRPLIKAKKAVEVNRVFSKIENLGGVSN